MYNLITIKEILENVRTGKNACDSQTAQDALQYMKDLETEIVRLAKEYRQYQDKLSRRNMQIRELKKSYTARLQEKDNLHSRIDVLEKIVKDNNLWKTYCNADFQCYAVGNTPETKGCITCKQYNR